MELSNFSEPQSSCQSKLTGFHSLSKKEKIRGKQNKITKSKKIKKIKTKTSTLTHPHSLHLLLSHILLLHPFPPRFQPWPLSQRHHHQARQLHWCESKGYNLNKVKNLPWDESPSEEDKTDSEPASLSLSLPPSFSLSSVVLKLSSAGNRHTHTHRHREREIHQSAFSPEIEISLNSRKRTSDLVPITTSTGRRTGYSPQPLKEIRMASKFSP